MCSWVREKHEEYQKSQEKKKGQDADKAALKDISVRKDGGQQPQKRGGKDHEEPLMGYALNTH